MASAWTEKSVALPGRGPIFVRESAGPQGAPTLVLLHGLGATGLLNWRSVFSRLEPKYRVVVVDHRGHGRGMRIRAPFRLADCADDVAVLADELEIERFIPVGYSMGGPIAQLLWQRHRARIEGLVLCATSYRFGSKDHQRASHAFSPMLNWAGRLAPRRTLRRVARNWLLDAIEDPAIREHVMSEVASSDPITVGQAAAAIVRFDSTAWIGEIDVPVSVVLTERDELVAPTNQKKMAERIPGAVVFPVAAAHSACVTHPGLFGPALGEACESVVARAQARARKRS
ncbi:MAG TPA: alpha/beta hydrolase [Myxococcota bacterium]